MGVEIDFGMPKLCSAHLTRSESQNREKQRSLNAPRVEKLVLCWQSILT